MAKTFKLEIVTPEKVVYSNDVQGVVANGTEGSFGVLVDHAPLITELQSGTLTVTDENNKTIEFELNGGFFEVSSNNVIVLTERCTQEDG